jgi:D-alanyl-lipoteichoic acid acyltransferase DltB (MBOAT superfamily)
VEAAVCSAPGAVDPANFWIASRFADLDERAAKRLLIVGIMANLAVLGWFKYADFVLSIFQGHKPGAPEVPLALSFTTFVPIAFLVDVWRRRASVAFAPMRCSWRSFRI